LARKAFERGRLHPPSVDSKRIIDRDTWDAVQVLLREHATNYKTRAVAHRRTDYLLTGLLRCGCCNAAMQISGGSPHRYYRCIANRKHGTCTNSLSVKEPLARTRILEAISQAIATPKAAEYVRRRLVEQAGALSRDAGRELEDRTARLARVTERIRGLIAMQADGDRSPMVAERRVDLGAQAQQERVAIQELRAVTDAPIRLPPVAILTERVLQLRTFAAASNIQGAREALRRYLKGGEISLIPDGDAYVARAEFMPLALLADIKTTPSEFSPGGRCQSVVARGGFEPPTFGL